MEQQQAGLYVFVCLLFLNIWCQRVNCLELQSDGGYSIVVGIDADVASVVRNAIEYVGAVHVSNNSTHCRLL